MAPCPPVSTSLASLLPGLILCLPILLFHVLFLIMMLFFLVSLFLNPFPVVLADGWWVRSRIKWAEGGATSTRFFLRMEEKWAAESWISAMRVSNVVVRDLIPSASLGILFTKIFLQPLQLISRSCRIFLIVSLYLFLSMMLTLVTIQSRLTGLMQLSLA